MEAKNINISSNEIRQAFLDFFKSKSHQIIPSAPIVIKNDPTLMFTNAGMNQFKDIFLGNTAPKYKRVANTQKCLRVSGKHNDLEEVGIDTYHHTMFEMLGNWSFGDYFKKEAIAWSWELLTNIYKIPEDRLYITIFEGSKKENLAMDEESYGYWKQLLAEERILKGNKKDNFWEMGEIGPCGPCTEIHMDLRPEKDRKQLEGKQLVNTGHPQVIEIWNNVFIEFNRLADGSLQRLPSKHVDTGMGFERLCMALQNKSSSYDTDIFQPIIKFVAKKSGLQYGHDTKTDIAMRVVADHIRAIAFVIADGQLPSNTGAGYVIRRILRRAVRYGYTFLEFKEAFLYKLVNVLSKQFEEIFPEIKVQQGFIEKVIQEEENSFLKTLGVGMQKFSHYISTHKDKSSQKLPDNFLVDGKFAFELYDTYGFPVDLTRLLAREENVEVDMKSFDKSMEEQKERSRAASALDAGDWNILGKEEATEFVGYDKIETEVEITKYRKVKTKNKEQFQLVFNRTPFYAESGGQVGDTGFIESKDGDKIYITDTQKENDLIIHYTEKLPKEITQTFIAKVDKYKRTLTANNHSATHLLHAALKQVLGTHVNQKGSLVNSDYLRFDFSHFAKVTEKELEQIESIVNKKIRENISLNEQRNIPIKEALEQGATALFGEKYGEFVRVITFDKSFSVELCGGIHVPATGQIGLFKIIYESAVAAGVRRIEAITADKAEEYINEKLETLKTVEAVLKSPKDVIKGLQALLDQNTELQNKLNSLINEKVKVYKTELLGKIQLINGINYIGEKIDLPTAEAVKNLSFELKQQVNNLFLILGSKLDDKVHLSVIISDNLVKERKLNANDIIREIAKEIEGGGGGQAFYATAGGKNIAGLEKALQKAKDYLIKEEVI